MVLLFQLPSEKLSFGGLGVFFHFFFLVWPLGLWDLSSLTQDRTLDPQQ